MELRHGSLQSSQKSRLTAFPALPRACPRHHIGGQAAEAGGGAGVRPGRAGRLGGTARTTTGDSRRGTGNPGNRFALASSVLFFLEEAAESCCRCCRGWLLLSVWCCCCCLYSPPSSPGENSENGAYVCHVVPEAYRRELAKGFHAAIVAKALREHGHLNGELGRLAYLERLPGLGHQRVYRIRSSIIAEYWWVQRVSWVQPR